MARRRLHWLLALETGAFLALLLSGLAAMRMHGWGVGYPRWLALKLGLVAFLLVPLEAIYAYAARGFLARGLRPEAPPFPRDLERGVSMQEMVWALAVPLVGLIALPLLLWLSLARPF